jgi:hypothetical protein
MTTMTDLAGYLASTMVLLTFLTKDMRLLRVLGILSNVAFIAYAVLDSLTPVLVLHLLLLPINVFRLRSVLVEEGLPAAGSCLSAITMFFGARSHRLPPLALAEELPPRHRQRAGYAVGAAQAVPHDRGSDVCLFAMQPARPIRAGLIYAGGQLTPPSSPRGRRRGRCRTAGIGPRGKSRFPERTISAGGTSL